MPTINLDVFRDKVMGCWAGKNIGGTIGGPFENKTGPHNVTFYTHNIDGDPLPNDDLDLQLIWLSGIEKYFSPYYLTPRIMGQFWHDFIIGPWNEYAICVKNVSHGFYPPLSGVVNNNRWKWSNGAWIRSEIWACCTPGSPDEAIQFAWLDACCDHCGEGIFAEMFTVALESAAFVESDVQKLIDIALARIPADSRVGRAVRLARQMYRDGKTWQEAREALVKDSEDLGTFQAPCNVAFAVVGLLWGEGDMGKTVCTAVNCGDDTDCTAGTAGAVLGIIQGFSKLPEKWLKPIGMGIKTIAITHFGDVWPRPPKTVQELTDRVVNAAWQTAVSNPRLPQFSSSSSGFTEEERARLMTLACPGCFYDDRYESMAHRLWKQSSTEMQYQLDFGRMIVGYPADPEAVPGEPFRLSVRFHRCTKTTNDLTISIRLPEGWTSPCTEKMLYHNEHRGEECTFDLIAPENAKPLSYVELVIVKQDCSCPIITALPLQIKGHVLSSLLRETGDWDEYGARQNARSYRKLDLP